MPTPPTYYYLSFESFGAPTVAGVGNAPLAVDLTGEGLRLLRPINEWLRPGENTLTLSIAHTPLEAIGEHTPQIACSIFEADPASEVPVAKRELASFRWPDPDLEVQPEFPLKVKLPFKLAEAPECRLWTEAETIKRFEDADRREILAIVERFRRAVLEGKGAEAYALARYKFEEDARANGFDLASFEQTTLAQYRFFVNQKGLHAPPLPGREAELSRIAYGKLVSVGRGQTTHTVIIDGDDMTTTISLYFAKIAGQWRIAR